MRTSIGIVSSGSGSGSEWLLLLLLLYYCCLVMLRLYGLGRLVGIALWLFRELGRCLRMG